MKKTVVLAAVLVLTTPACRIDWSERITGVGLGAAGGALVGGLLGSAVATTGGGIVLGALAGAAAGYIYGDYLADQRERSCCSSPCEAPSGSASEPLPVAVAPMSHPVLAPAPPAALAGVSAARVPDPGAWGPASRGAAAREEYEAGRRAVTANGALSRYAAAIRLDPRRPEPYNAQGLVYLYLGRSDAARRSFEQSLTVDSNYQPARYNLKKVTGGV